MKIIVLLLLSYTLLIAQTNEDCLDCHNDKDLNYERNKKTVSLYLNESNFYNSAHKKVECIKCHKGFDAEEIPHKEGNNIYKVNCSLCHKEIANQQANDIHKRLKLEPGQKIPNCQSCHNYHYTKPVKSITDQSKYFCSSCHTSEKNTAGFHSKQFISNETCADCHDEVEEINLSISNSIHKNLLCIDCHTYISKNFENHEEEPELALKAECSTCHTEIAKEHKNSIHGIMLNEGVSEAADCKDCHGSHEILPPSELKSKVNPSNLAITCGNCHDDPKFAEKFSMSVSLPGKMYSQSVHGKLVIEKHENAATCTTCHGVHNIKNRVQEGSPIAPINVPNACIECHPKEVEEYKNSIHWTRVQRGINEAPVCNDCHSEHSIEEIKGEGKDNNQLAMQQRTCIRCHENSRIANKFGKEGGQVEQYLISYHGLATTRGHKAAAMCVDCHGIHSINNSGNPQASTHQNNVTATCQKCHTNASEVFAKSYSHKTESDSARAIESTVRNIYFWLIIAVIGGMFLHNLIIFYHETRRKRNKEKNTVTMPRFTRNEVIQHILLALSFIILAITGFALKYPKSFWAEGLFSIGMTETIRQYTHRVSAVIMIILSLYHVFYLAFTARGRDVFLELLPKFDDIKAVVDNLSYYLRLSKQRPSFEQYDYAEKAEYWALIWGTLVMAATGLILWFPTLVGEWAPVWLIKVSETIHFMEAILATLAIIVWHWFFVIYRPSQYPMSFTWIDGKMPLEHYRHHHDRHFRRILLEWYEFNSPSHPRNKLTTYTKLFKDTLEKNGYQLENVIQGELNKDLELRMWYEDEITKYEQSIA